MISSCYVRHADIALLGTHVKQPAKLKLYAGIAILEKNKRSRLPIVDSAGKLLHILHRNYIDQFFLKHAEAVGTQLEEAKRQDLLTAKDLKLIFQSFTVVEKEAKLIAVKQAVDETRESKALGWIANVIVQEKTMR